MELLRGKVVSGRAGVAHWMKKLENEYIQKTGVNLFPGTVAIQLEQPFQLKTSRLVLDTEKQEGVALQPCFVNGIEAYILHSNQREQPSQTLIEIIFDKQERESHFLSYGDGVEVMVPILEALKTN
ncbi:hypothetical protein ACOI1C_00510 [Bacillus sp. DJP31]|uniref:hypothetical protein n=1 Tax=Bacillus sp. DJP31 TaxID=3409789 RepID=UPI003BB48962